MLHPALRAHLLVAMLVDKSAQLQETGLLDWQWENMCHPQATGLQSVSDLVEKLHHQPKAVQKESQLGHR
jgi:hypothetical protein